MAKGLEILETEVAQLRERKENENLTPEEIKRINGQIRAKSISISRYKRNGG